MSDSGRESSFPAYFAELTLIISFYVILEIVRLRGVYSSLVSRTSALKAASKPVVSTKEADGYELTESASTSAGPPETDAQVTKAKLFKDWNDWKVDALLNA